jgi:hypothetical protein
MVDNSAFQIYGYYMNTRTVIIILLVIAIIGGGIYFLRGYEAPVDASPPVTSDPYEGWETYTNEEYGFSFKYPEEYILEKPLEAEDPKKRDFPTNIFGDVKLDAITLKDKPYPYGIRVLLDVYENKDNLTSEEWFSQKKIIRTADIHEERIIGGIPMVWDESFAQSEDNLGLILVVFGNGDAMFDIQTSIYQSILDPSFGNGTDLFRKILESFKFE